MKRLLLIPFLALCLGFIPTASKAQVTTSFDRPLVWGASPFQDSLWAIDTSIGWNAIVYRIAPSLPSFTITGITGMATDPTTGITYVIMKVSAVSGRVLGTIDLPTGICTQVGNLGDNFSSITFREDGQLFGVTGDGATVPETLYLIDKATGTTTIANGLGAGADGEVICYNPFDNFFYHWSGNGTVVYERLLSTAPYTATNIPTTGAASGETFGAMYLTPTTFLRSNISSNFNRHTTSGVYSPTFGANPDDLRGLVMLPYFTMSDDSICEETETVTITAGGHSLLTHVIIHWGDGSFDTVATTPGVLATATHTYTSPGAMTVDIETYNGSGGDTVYTNIIQVNNIPNVTISGMSTICSGDSITLTGSSGGTSQWYMNGVLIPGATTNTYSTDQPGVYNMIKTNLNGCGDSAAVGVIAIVSPNPVITLGPDTAGCAWFVMDAGPNGAMYVWNTGGLNQLDTVMATGQYDVTVTDSLGCVGRDTINVTINPLPVVDLGPDTTACGSVMLDAGNPGATYTWCNLSTGQTVVLSSSGTCEVMVTDSNGCSANDSINVTINPNPVVNLGPDVSACTMVVITADSSLIGGTFVWCNGDSALNTIITTSSTCDLIYTDVNGCMGYDTINITIYGNPTVTASAAPAALCADDADATLTGSPAGGSFTGTSVTGNNFDPSVGAGTYQVVYSYVDTNGCSGADTISIQVNACVGIEENNAAAFTLYPNPTTGLLNFTLTTTATVEVFDVLGNVVESKQFNSGNAQIDLSNQPNGVYLVRVNGATQRVVLQK